MQPTESIIKRHTRSAMLKRGVGILSIVLLAVLVSGCSSYEDSQPSSTVTSTEAIESTLRSSPGEESPPLSSLPVTIVYHNATIITLNPEQPYAQAIAIAGDRIHSLGEDEEILTLADEQTQVIDLAGLVVVAGFIDSHNHRITQRDHWGFSTVQQAVTESLQQGWTGLVDTATDDGHLKEMIAVDAAGNLHTRVNVYLVVNESVTGEFFGDWYQAYQPGQEFSPFLRIAGLKIFIDLNIGQNIIIDQTELDNFIRLRQEEGWQVAIRVLGGQGNEMALNAITNATNGNSAEYRYRFEHNLVANDDQIARMAELGIIASIEPPFPAVFWHEPEIKDAIEVWGLENSFRWRDYWDAGIFMTASTHNPPTWEGWVQSEEFFGYSHLSPMGVLYRGVNQIGLGGAPPEPWMLEKALGLEELMQMLTIHGAYGTFEEDIKGNLMPGKWADLVVLSANPYETPAKDIADIQVKMTMVGGKVAYCADATESMCLSPIPISAPDFTLAAGNWIATDNRDGSAMKLTVIHLGEDNFSITYYDSDAIFCVGLGGQNEPVPWISNGIGTATSLTLELWGLTGKCVDYDKALTFDYSLTYDPLTDTLRDNYDQVWERE